MRRLRTAVAALTLVTAPAVLMAQRGPEPQQGTGQNNPDMERSPSGKSAQPSTSNVPNEQGTRKNSPDTQGTGQNNPATQQTRHHNDKQNHKKHGGSHDQASPQA